LLCVIVSESKDTENQLKVVYLCQIYNRA
jgi:hypothetical protein